MSHSDLEGAVLNVKYMKGLNNWIPLPAIQQVSIYAFWWLNFGASLKVYHF